MGRLEVLGRAEHPHPARCHDADALGEYVGLVHVVRRQQHDAILRRLADAVPDEAARAYVDSGRGLVDKDDLGRAARESHRRRELALRATRQRLRLLVGVFGEAVPLLDVLDRSLQRGAGEAFELEQDGQVLAQRERRPDALELRAEAGALEDLHQATVGWQAVERRHTRRGHVLAGEDVDGGRLARAVGPQEGEADASGDRECEVVNGAQLGAAEVERGREGLRQLAQRAGGRREVLGEALDAHGGVGRVRRGEPGHAGPLGGHVGVLGQRRGRRRQRRLGAASDREAADLDGVEEGAEQEARDAADDQGEARAERRGRVVARVVGLQRLGDEREPEVVGRREGRRVVELLVARRDLL
mmetsp:Transcript_58458/g.173731  ORF Transcript_58458/g.173731 Transcript_58458/m.173731 type:complete len:359 (+) Transcript_58458:1420-2496(+)